MIDLRTLGTLDLRVRDGPELLSVLSQPKRTALLCHLALAEPHGFHRRDTLLALFWPEADAEHAHASLRQAVRFLRRSLGEDVIRARGDDDLALGEGVLECDAVVFEEALAAGDHERALRLYRGELLPGFYVEGAPDFERWLEAERTRLRASAVAAAWAVAEARERAGDAAGAAEWARAALALAPDDAALRRLMQTLERLGDREGALAAYESWARRLRAEYEIEPSADAHTLAEAIRARGAAPAGRAATATHAAAGRAMAPRRAVEGTAAPSAPVDQVAEAAEAASAEPTVAPPPTALRGRRRRWWIAAAVAVVGGAVLGGWVLRRAHRGLPVAAGTEVRSLAVLPLVDLSPGRDQGYFADGVTSELIDLVGQIDGLRVPGPTSSFYFKGKNLPLREVARQLGVAHVLEGGVLKDGRRIRVTIRLTDAASDRQLWSRSYETESGDIAAIQHQIASYVAANIATRSAELPSRPPANPQVYDLYLQGLYTTAPVNARTGNWEPSKAIGLFGAALRLDSAFAPAWAGMAHAQYRAGDFAQAKAAARRALALDSTLPLARQALAGSLAYGDWNWREAERILDAGIRLAPSSAILYLARANLRFVLGRERDAFADHDRAEAIEPLSLEVARDRVTLLNWTDHWADWLHARERLPLDDPYRSPSGEIQSNYMLGNRDTALALARRLKATDHITLMEGNRDSLTALVQRLEATGDPCPVARALRRYWLYHQGRSSAAELHEVQTAYADHRYACLEAQVNARFRFVAFALRDSECDSLRAQPRFQALMRRVGLPD